MRFPVSNLAVFAVALVVLACGQYRKIQKNPDWRVKFEAGQEYYEEKDYFRASELFETILPVVRGLPEGEEVEFKLGYCYYHQRLYLLASNQFQSFYETYGRSSFTEEAQFMYAYSLFVSSPDYNLDQQNSLEAMAAMQNFLNQYPASSFSARATEIIISTQVKVEKKYFENARQYLKLRMYKAAVIAFDNFALSFPDSHHLEEVAYLKVLAEYRLARQSIQNRQKERYATVVEFYKNLVDNYPESEYLKDAEKLYSESLDQLNKLNNNKNS
jgi:outer membrane protein assembly factor BamD